MPKKINLIVEGICDDIFVQQLIAYLKIPYDDIKSQLLQGNLYNIPQIKNQFHQATDNDFENILIIDADDDCDHTETELKKIIEENDLVTKYFILPNHQDSGNLETLLIQILKSNHSEFFDCFDDLDKCLAPKPYDSPNNKALVFALLESVGLEGKCEKRNYSDQNHWDLDHEYLKPLKDFLLESVGT